MDLQSLVYSSYRTEFDPILGTYMKKAGRLETKKAFQIMLGRTYIFDSLGKLVVKGTCIVVVYLTMFSVSQTMWMVQWVMNDELVRIWKEVVVMVQFKIPHRDENITNNLS